MQPDNQEPTARDRDAQHAAHCAAHWLATLSDEQCTDAERQQFLDWLRASTHNVDEFLRLSRLSRHARRRELWPDERVEDLIAAARATANVTTFDPRVESAPVRRARQPMRWAIAASIVLAVGIGVVALRAPISRWFSPEYVTAVGEQRSITLGDGSVVELNSQSRLVTRFTRAVRAVELTDGEAIFRVTKDPKRPFRVRTGATDIVAVGTAFNVKASDSRTVVTVLEGRVRVNQRAENAARLAAAPVAKPIELAVGDQLIVARSQPAVRVSLQDTEKVTSWTERRLIFEDTPISAAAAEFGRYSQRQIRIEDPRIGERKINGVFDATDPASLVEFLRADETVAVREDGDGWVVQAHAPVR
jgi:transmembrane sensor